MMLKGSFRLKKVFIIFCVCEGGEKLDFSCVWENFIGYRVVMVYYFKEFFIVVGVVVGDDDMVVRKFFFIYVN